MPPFWPARSLACTDLFCAWTCSPWLTPAAPLQGIFDSNDAHEMPLAAPFATSLNTFQKLLFLRCLRPDKVMMAIGAFVVEHMGPRFVEPPPFDLAATFRESDSATPLIFVLSAGADPMVDLLKLADEMKFAKKFEKVSLGQGQGPKAERLLREGMERGLWVCLQNCHLAVSWMPAMDRIIEGIDRDKVRGAALARGAATPVRVLATALHSRNRLQRPCACWRPHGPGLLKRCRTPCSTQAQHSVVTAAERSHGASCRRGQHST
jgi:hypothetical protein